MTGDQVWQAVASPNRRRLIELLRDGPRTTGELCGAFRTTRFATMKHLAVLERAGIVEFRRQGRERWNVLNPEPLREIEGRWPGLLPDERRAPAGTAPTMPVRDAAPTPTGSTASTPTLPATAPIARASTQVFIDAPPWRVFDALTQNVAAWWGGPHLRSADATNVVLEPQPGGRLVEEWGHRQGALRAVVTAIKQDEHLELTGALVGQTTGVLSIRLERREGGTLLRAELLTRGTDAEEPNGAKRALDDLFKARLKAFVEEGARSGVAS
jgi:DNA-binding transcriptional ArsR family regulator/uncharacterized protein YndB with AHSA1/START domain